MISTFAQRQLFAVMWIAWALCWWALSFNVKAAVRREPMVSRLLHIVPLGLAAYLLWTRRCPLPVLCIRVWPDAQALFWIGAAMTLSGFLFTVWARVHLGRNWSGIVTVKDEHELVTSGPYRLVRHPIYTGLLLAFLGSALALGEWRGVLALVIAWAALWRKLRIEERWMRERFGDAYDRYAEDVPALLPRLR